MLAGTASSLSTLYYIAAVGVFVLAGLGYWRNSGGRAARAAADAWKNEHEAEKTRADRLASELAQTAAELRIAEQRTDITHVLQVLQGQHKEATGILTRIADESAARNGHIADALASSNERVAGQHVETVKMLGRIADEAGQRNAEITHIVSETLKTVSALRTIEAAAQELAARVPTEPTP